jgi:hypothetical protein
MRIFRAAQYLVYVTAFSLWCSLASQTVMALSAWSWGHPLRFGYTVSDLPFHLPQHILLAVLQVTAAGLIMRSLSLRKLFCLSCFFTVIAVLIGGFSRQVTEMLGSLSLYVLLPTQLLPYVPSVMILALSGRKGGLSVPAPDASGQSRESPQDTATDGTKNTGDRLRRYYARYWYVLDVVLIGIVLLYGTLNDPSGLIWHVCGLLNRMSVPFAMGFIWVLLIVPIALCSFLLLLRILGSWPEHIERGHRLSMLQAFAISGLILYSLFSLLSIGPSRFSIYMRGFAKCVEHNADLAAIRTWLGTLEPDDCVVYYVTNPREGTKSSRPKYLEQARRPAPIAAMEPKNVVLSLYDDESPRVRLTWGGGLTGHWGLVVGPESMPTPESDLSRYGEHRQEIQSGVYVWYGP